MVKSIFKALVKESLNNIDTKKIKQVDFQLAFLHMKLHLDDDSGMFNIYKNLIFRNYMLNRYELMIIDNLNFGSFKATRHLDLTYSAEIHVGTIYIKTFNQTDAKKVYTYLKSFSNQGY